jgi:hypothetical protein
MMDVQFEYMDKNVGFWSTQKRAYINFLFGSVVGS